MSQLILGRCGLILGGLGGESAHAGEDWEVSGLILGGESAHTGEDWEVSGLILGGEWAHTGRTGR